MTYAWRHIQLREEGDLSLDVPGRFRVLYAMFKSKTTSHPTVMRRQNQRLWMDYNGTDNMRFDNKTRNRERHNQATEKIDGILLLSQCDFQFC